MFIIPYTKKTINLHSILVFIYCSEDEKLLKVDIGVEKFYTLDPSIHISIRLEMPLDQMRIKYPIQEEDEQPMTNRSSSELVQPTTSTSIDLPSIKAYLIEPDQPSNLDFIDLPSTSTTLIESNQPSTSYSIDLPSTNTSLNESDFILIDDIPYKYTIANVTSQTTELPIQDESIQQNESTSNQNGSKSPPQKKMKTFFDREKKYICNHPNCDKTYFRSDHLSEHKKSKHENRKWQCQNCKTKFTTTRGKDKHIITYPEHVLCETFL